jgi:hypothetical protein
VFDAQFDRIIICLPSKFNIKNILFPNCPKFQIFLFIFITEDSEDVYYKYTQELSSYFPSLEVYYGLPNIYDLELTFNVDSKKLLIVDDLSSTFFKSAEMLKMFEVV